jgi:hypothetical protein
LTCFDEISCLVLPIPGSKESLQFLSKDSLTNASNYSQIVEGLLNKDFLVKLEELRSFLKIRRNRLKGFVSLISFHEFLIEALKFLQSDQQESKLQLLFERNYKVFERSLLEQFTTEILHELHEMNVLDTSLVNFKGRISFDDNILSWEVD